MAIRNKRGWIKIIEAFLAVILLASIILVVLDKQNNAVDVSPTVHDAEILILRSMELNKQIRSEILSTSGNLGWTEFNSTLPLTKAKIQSLTPASLNCEASACNPFALCASEKIEKDNVYSDSIIISSELTVNNPRLLKIFCWEK